MNLKYPIAEPDIGDAELKLVVEAIKSGWVSSKGPFISQFEEQFSDYFGPNFGVSTSNGTTALHLALLALGIGAGDEVVVPTLTFVASANTVKYTGARPVFVDSTLGYWCIDTEKIEEKINNKTKAIMPVHIYGHPCDMDPILRIAKKYGLYVIEDCAEAHGAEYKGKKVGSFGDISCFSFYGNKIITTGEGGMCLTNDQDLAEKMRVLRDHGMSPQKRYWHDVIGYNYRMTNVQAAIGVAQLSRINQFIEKKRHIADMYGKLLNDAKGLQLHPQMPWAKNIYWLYSVVLKPDSSVTSGLLATNLANAGIDSRPFFYPVHKLPPYKESSVYPVAEYLSKAGLNLPSSTKLSDDDLIAISEKVSAFIQNNRALAST